MYDTDIDCWEGDDIRESEGEREKEWKREKERGMCHRCLDKWIMKLQKHAKIIV